MSPEWIGDASQNNTENWGFQILRGQSVGTNDYAFTDRDRVLMDALFNYAVNAHQHLGTSRLTNPLNDATPTETVTLVQAATGGDIPAGVLACYRVSFYDSSGETVAGPEVTEQIISPVATPAQSTVATASAGGTLTSGFFMYKLTAVKGSGETLAGDPASVVVGSATATNKNTITFPAAPAGATHWNIYRKKDNGHWYYTHQEVVASATYDDTGDADGAEGLPASNDTNSTNKVTITISGAPAGAVGYRIYRSILSGVYGSYSLIFENVVADLDQVDIYANPDYGMPLEASTTYGSPPKVNLPTEVQNHLNTSHITPLDSNLDFAKYLAVKMRCDQGTSFPETPGDGQWFYRTDLDDIYVYMDGLSTPAWVAFGLSTTNYVWPPLSFYVEGSLWDSDLATPAIKTYNRTEISSTVLTIDKVYAYCKTAPVAAATPISAGVRIDILKNGVSIFSADGDKPLIPNGSNADESNTPNTTALAKNDLVTMEIEIIDDTHTAADLMVFVRCKENLSS